MTRIGKYVWDIDMEFMGKEELEALRDGADYFIKTQEKAELQIQLDELMSSVKEKGFKILKINEDEEPVELKLGDCVVTWD